MRKQTILLLCCLFLLTLGFVGCRSSAPAQPTLAPSPTLALEARPTMTPLPSPTPTHTPGPTPTLVMAGLAASAQGAGLEYWSDPNDVLALIADERYLWAATSAGVVRWGMDGSQRAYGLADGLASLATRGLAQDGDGHLWVGYSDYPGWSELVSDDAGAAETWRTYPTRREAVEARYQAMLAATRTVPALWASREDSDWVWLATADGQLEAYDGALWRTYDDYKGVTTFTWLVDLTPEGRVWAVGRGISTAEEGEVWWEDHNLFSDITSRLQVTDMALDQEGGLWLSFTGVGARGGGACRYDPTEGLWQGYLAEFNPLIPGQVFDMDIDADGTIWLCGEGGLAYQQLREPWRLIALPGVTVKTYARGPRGRLWLGTNRGIWSAWPDGSDLKGPWRVPAPILGSAVVALVEDAQGQLWVGTDQGVTVVDAEGRSRAVLQARVTCLEQDNQGQVWAGAAQGLFNLSLGDQPVLTDSVVALAFAPDGVPWICDEQGQARPVGDKSSTPLDLLALAGALPREMDFDTSGTLWFATGEGLGILAADGTFELQTRADRLLSDDVRSVDVAPDDTVWVATDMGLVRRRLDGRWTRFTPQSTEGGLRAWEMWGLYADAGSLAAGELWMTTSSGISRREPANADWSYLDLPEARCVLPDRQAQAGEGGAIWVGTRSGLYRLRLDAMVRVPE